jgi:hypothetical protein
MRDHIFSRAYSLLFFEVSVSRLGTCSEPKRGRERGEERQKDVLLLPDADRQLVPPVQHYDAGAGEEGGGPEAAGWEVALRGGGDRG